MLNKIKFNKLFLLFFTFCSFHYIKPMISSLKPYKVVIIGSGPAGLSAAIYASRSQLDPIIIEGDNPGGQLAKASIIENWPGTVSIEGETLINTMRNHALHYSAKFIPQSVKEIDLNQKPFKLILDNDRAIYAHTIIACTGGNASKLACPGEDEYLGKGIAVCATCDAPLFKDKLVVVIGGNNAAMREVNILSKFTDRIIVINKGSEIYGQRHIIQSIRNHPNIKIINNAKAVEIVGNGNWVTGVKIEDANGKIKTIPAEGVFIAIGTDPASSLFKGKLDLDEKSRIKITNDTNTSVDGVFAAGDVTTKGRHQVPAAANFGYIAGMDAEEYLRKTKVI